VQLTSSISVNSESFKSNYRANIDALNVCKEISTKISKGGPEKSRERHVARGKMLPRDRISNLLDPGSPFLEIGATAAYDLYGNEAPCAGIITGSCRIHCQDIMVV
jgi:3-methylcrotonyl-CoA carboxylase beta subunit